MQLLLHLGPSLSPWRHWRAWLEGVGATDFVGAR